MKQKLFFLVCGIALLSGVDSLYADQPETQAFAVVVSGEGIEFSSYGLDCDAAESIALGQCYNQSDVCAVVSCDWL